MKIRWPLLAIMDYHNNLWLLMAINSHPTKWILPPPTYEFSPPAHRLLFNVHWTHISFPRHPTAPLIRQVPTTLQWINHDTQTPPQLSFCVEMTLKLFQFYCGHCQEDLIVSGPVEILVEMHISIAKNCLCVTSPHCLMLTMTIRYHNLTSSSERG